MKVTNQDQDAFDMFLLSLDSLAEIVHCGVEKRITVTGPEIIRRNRLMHDIHWLFARDDVVNEITITIVSMALHLGVELDFTAKRKELVEHLIAKSDTSVSFEYQRDSKSFIMGTELGSLVVPINIGDTIYMDASNAIMRDMLYVDAKALWSNRSSDNEVWETLLAKKEYSALRTQAALGKFITT